MRGAVLVTGGGRGRGSRVGGGGVWWGGGGGGGGGGARG